MADDSVNFAQARAILGSQLAAFRNAAGYTQTSFAHMTFYGRSSIANIETGRQSAPRHFWTLCDEILRTGNLLANEHDRLAAAYREHQLVASANLHAIQSAPPGYGIEGQHGANSSELPTDTDDDMVDVLARVHRLSRKIDPQIITLVGSDLRQTLAHYDRVDHHRLTATLVKRRTWLVTLIDDCPDPRQREQLFESAALTSGLLGYLAVGRSAFGLARAYCLEAFQLADFVPDPNLLAWTRGMQSFCEYYAGDYPEALRLALDGARHAGQNPQSVRLTINGVARAAGKVGDVEAVRRAVSKAYDLMAQQETPAGIPSSISLGCYSPAQVAGNAATAFVSLGMPNEVQHFVDLAMPDVTKSDSPWTQSLVMLDLATALVRSSQHDLDHASGLALSALSISRGRPIVSVSQRTRDFIHDATVRWGSLAQVNSVREALSAMSDPA
ncbi:helix-turn-helix transcriptional regulator [Catellatospora sp. NPDC049111]|uniref:helix-turn-helix domain-containing protein n=1 Tax=Catellatospora sp. NPDC049111 TaxID=3155271 RepID=UPI0033EF2F08